MACKMPDDSKLSDEERLIKGAITAFSLKMFRAMQEQIRRKTGWNNTDYRNHFAKQMGSKMVEICAGRPEACVDLANYAMMLYKCLKARLRRSGTVQRETLHATIGRRHRT